MGVIALRGRSTLSLEGTSIHDMYFLCLSFGPRARREGQGLNLGRNKVDGGDTGRGWDLTGERLSTRRAQVPRALGLCPAQVVEAVPMLLRIPGLAAKLIRGQKVFMTLIDELITEQKMTWDPTQPPRHLTDAFLDEVKEVR